MGTAKRRFVDPHMHLWDLDTNPWYHFPVPGNDYGFGLKAPFPDRYVFEDYAASLASVELLKCVHVTAVTGAHDVAAENQWIAAIADRHPEIRAIIDTVNLSQPIADIIASIDYAMTDPRYRGIRLLAGVDYESPLAHQLLTALQKRGLVYDCVANPGGGLSSAAKALSQYPDLTIVLEHTGWPLKLGTGAFNEWRQEMAEFAALPNANCKLSGLGMTIHRNDLPVFKQYFDACIQLFGANRCMFASNFPVDLSYGPADELLALFESVAGHYSDQQADALFAGTAERVYRI